MYTFHLLMEVSGIPNTKRRFHTFDLKEEKCMDYIHQVIADEYMV